MPWRPWILLVIAVIAMLAYGQAQGHPRHVTPTTNNLQVSVEP